MSELKPCPFCGSEDYYITVTDNPFSYDTYSTAHCSKCHATGPFVAESYLEGEPKPTRDYMESVAKEKWQTRPIEDDLNASIAILSQAVGLITTLKPTMVMDVDHPLDMAKEVVEHVTARIAELEDQLEDWTNNGWAEDYKARIAELEARLESCESALASMVYQFFYQPELGVLAHSFMSAEEEACEYLIKYGIAHWSNERKNSIVFDEVQELPKESEE